MIGHRDFTIEDYITILRRRLWIIVVPAIVGPALALAVAFVLPEKFESKTLILVQQQKVPENFIRSIVTDELNNRIATVRELVFSRTRLEPLIGKYGLYRETRGKASLEELVAQLRRDIEVTAIRPIIKTKNEEVPGFFITVTASEARTAQQVCAEITSMFLEENLRFREQRAVGTTQFLDAQLREARSKLDEQDKRVAAFRQRYMGQLPGQEDMNLKLLTSLNTQLEAVTQVLSRAQQDKTYMQSLLAQQVSAWQASQAGTNVESLEQQLPRMENELAALEARYTSDHPDVIKMKNDIAQVRKRVEEAQRLRAQTPKKDEVDDPSQGNATAEIRALRNQIRQADVTIGEKTRQQELLQNQIKTVQARIQLSPVVEQQYKELTRDYETALGFYNDLLKKKNESEVATDMERRQQGEQFQVMDPASYPSKPSFPNRLKFAGGGFGGGLALGLAIALLLEMLDKSLRTERDVEALLGVPTLAVVPVIGSESPKRGRGKLHHRTEPAQRLSA